MKNLKDLISPSAYAKQVKKSHPLINYYIGNGQLAHTVIGGKKFISKKAVIKPSTIKRGRPTNKSLKK